MRPPSADFNAPKKGGGHGDLYVRLNLTVPKELSDEERALYEQLRTLQSQASGQS